MLIELRHLRAFVALAEELSFTRAAERLHVAQQALSSQIRQLEERTGTALVERTTRRVALTQAGEAFLPHARAALAASEQAVGAAREVAGGMAGELTLGLSATTSLDITPQLLRAFSTAHPGVLVSVRTATWTNLTGGLADRSADVALVRPPFAGDEDLELLHLLDEPRVAVLPPTHPLAERDEDDPEELLGEPWIWVRDADPVSAAFWTLAEQRGRRKVRVGAAISGAEDYFEVVRSERAIGISPQSLSRAAPDLCFPVVRGVAPATVALAWRPDDTRSLVAAFVEVARSVAAGSVSNPAE